MLRVRNVIGLTILLATGCCWYAGEAAGRRSPVEPARLGQVIRVCLASGGSEARVSAGGELRLAVGGRHRVLSAGQEAKLRGGAMLRVMLHDGEWYRGRDTLNCTASTGALIVVNGRTYRGAILAFVSARDSLVVVNELDLEEYLYGVVPCEIGPINSETFEAVKAQAVTARSFTLSRLGRRRHLGFDLFDTYVRDQEYQGTGRETDLGRRAVDDTRGVVLMTDRGEPAEALYHGNCGGRTANGHLSYLKSVVDAPGHRAGTASYCAWSRNYRWTATLSLDSVGRTLQRLCGLSRKPRVNAVSLESDRESGRVRKAVFRTSAGTLRVQGPELRMALGLRSHGFSVTIRGSSLVFRGRGWGHGSGLCQDGAVGMARAGRDWRSILRHYYPGLTTAQRY